MRRADLRFVPCLTAIVVAALTASVPAPLVAAEPDAVAQRPAPPAPSSVPRNPRLTGTPLLRVWGAEDYGASLLNLRLLVHPNGFLYVANEDGVLEFDGARWRLIPLPRNGAARSLACDAAGRVWVFGHDDLARLEPDASGELRAVSALELLPPDLRATGTINRAVATAEGVYARGQRRLMLFRPDGTVQSWPGAALVWTLDGALYADFDSLVRVRPGGLEPVSLGAGAAATTAENRRVFVTQPAGDRPGEWLLLTERGPVRWRGPGTPFQPLSAEASAPFATDLASAAVFLADGRLALGTERSGLFIFNRDGRLSQHFDHTHGLPANRIKDLAVDAEGGLWIALQEGLARLDLESRFALHGEPQGLSGTARRFATWRDQLYLATSEGVARRDATTGRFIAVDGFQVGANRPLVLGDRLVAATRGLREITADDHSRAWTTELIGPVVVAAQAPGWLYAGASAGLWLIQPDAATHGWKTAGRLTTLSLGLDELFDRGDGWLWAITRSGEIARVDFRGGPRLDAPTTLFTPAQGAPEPGRNDRVRLLPLGDELLAVAMDRMQRFDAATERFVSETRLLFGGVPVLGARLAGRSATGGAWIRPTLNPGRFLRAELAAGDRWRITEHSIAPFRGVDFDSLFEESSARTLWLTGQGVLTSVDLAWQPSRAPAPPAVYIRRIETASGELIRAHPPAASATDAPPAGFDSSHDALRIAYAAPTYAGDYRGRPLTLYRTRLDGLDREWSAWTTETHRDFTNLPSRALRFRVQARAPERPDSAEAVFAFAIAAPWWLTPWAFLGYVTVAAGAIFGGFKFRTRALRRRNEQLEVLIASRTRQLERLNQELTDAVSIVAHDLRGPIAGIRSLARQLRATPHLWTSAEGPEFLGEIERTSDAAVDMMARLLDLQRASDRAAGLAFAPTDVGALVGEVCRELSPAATAKRIALRVAAPPALGVIDAESVASVVANLVSNAIKFLPADGRGAIAVTLTATDRECRLTVTDNGPGIPAAERAAVFVKFAHGTARPTAGEASTGLGLFIVHKLVIAMGGTIDLADAPGGGAMFTVTWPARM